jgi:hypothetical protein
MHSFFTVDTSFSPVQLQYRLGQRQLVKKANLDFCWIFAMCIQQKESVTKIRLRIKMSGCGASEKITAVLSLTVLACFWLCIHHKIVCEQKSF